jgi:hypothetical protein
MALKCSPFALSFEPTALARRTVTAVPAGSVTSLGPNKLADLLEGALESELSSALLLEQPVEMAAHRNRNNEANITRCRCTGTSCYGMLIVARPVYYVEAEGSKRVTKVTESKKERVSEPAGLSRSLWRQDEN